MTKERVLTMGKRSYLATVLRTLGRASMGLPSYPTGPHGPQRGEDYGLGDRCSTTVLRSCDARLFEE